MTSRKLKVCAAVLLLASVVGCRPDAGWQATSMVNLIADAREYRGSDVFVSGYARVSKGKLFLFLGEEHARAGDIQSAVLLDRTLDGKTMNSVSACHDRFVTVFGRFEKLPTGLDGITEIERVIGYAQSGEIEGDCFSANGSGP